MNGQKRKPTAKEPPKARLLWLFTMILLFTATPACFAGYPLPICLLLGIFCADLFYFAFVVLKAHRVVHDSAQKTSQQQADAEATAQAQARCIAQEGIVLLQNTRDLLPLPQGTKINLIGLRGVQMCFNGGGSAAGDESKCVTLEEALQKTGFVLNQDFLNLSYNYLKNGKLSIQSPGKNYRVKQGTSQKGGAEFVTKPGAPVKSELPAEALTATSLYSDGKTILQHGAEFSDIAMVVLSRGGGEGYELDPGDLQLLESEKLLLDSVCQTFAHVILILNTCNTLEMGWLSDYPQIQGVFWIGFPGTVGNLALGDILNGTVSPSGHLPDTWCYSNLSTPAANNFCELVPDGHWSKESYHYTNAPEKKGYFVHYHEGIYVGYRYYETRSAVDPSFDYTKQVVWPFGHGLSYTMFQQKILSLTEDEAALYLTVQVRNEGKRAGKALVQVYLTAPYHGTIEKSSVALVAFEKTKLLSDAETDAIVLTIPKKDLSSFDKQSGKWILEPGSYQLTLRADAHTVLDAAAWLVEQPIYFKGTSRLFADAETNALTRVFDPKHTAFTGPSMQERTASDRVLAALDYSVPTDAELGLTAPPATATDYGIKLTDLKDAPKEDPRWDLFVSQLSVGELCNLCANGAWHTEAIPHLGVPRTLSPDGPTTLAATVFSALVMGKSRKGIIWPCPSVLAASFNKELASGMGRCIGQEARSMGYTGWYAPAINCHRTAFNSRNFEYYSEDPYLSGKIAANVVRAVQQEKVIPYIKHFALNERETNARDQLFTWCDEQTMREIYLKPFEIAVKEGGALGVMSCFNYIGTVWAGGSPALLRRLLREEWGFQGIVVTDACMYPHMDVVQMLYAGGDLSLDSLGGFTGGNLKRRSLLANAQDPARKVEMIHWMQEAAKNILYTVGRTM